jgi:hypothetical protein
LVPGPERTHPGGQPNVLDITPGKRI